MARTTANMRPEAAPDPSPRGLVSRYVYHGPGACGMCTILTKDGVRHDQCVGETHTNPGKKDDVVWRCQCAQKGHQP